MRTVLSSGLVVAALAVSSLATAQTIKVDHTTVDPSNLPQSALDKARALRLSFRHASVGKNVWDALGAFGSKNAARYAMPSVWSESDRGNPGWQTKVTGFEAWVAEHEDDYDVFMNKFCYIDPNADFDVTRASMEALKTRYPSKTFVWWTMPIMTSGGDNARRAAYNAKVREHAKRKDVPLFDIADIESHAPDGSAVLDRGVEAMAASYSSDGGHLNDAGGARVANAWWVLMARISGFNPSGAASNTGASPPPTGGPSAAPAQGAPPSRPNAGPARSATKGSGCAAGRGRADTATSFALASLFALAALRRRRAEAASPGSGSDR